MDILLRWDKADATSAFWTYLRHNPWRFARYFRYPIVAIIVSCIVIAEYPESWQVAGGLALFDIATITYQIFIFQHNANQRFRNSRLMQDTISIAIDGKSIRLLGQTVEREKQWDEFSAVLESNRLFLFVDRGNKVLYVPKSGLAGAQLPELRTLISTHAKGKVRLASS